ncbi:MAG TPA: ABC transporter substrate-binding protein [Ktedonobacteraceae bacterium]|nr:ABC transporter substrate-binding protein [Ktedonobacteraceae bacterium]
MSTVPSEKKDGGCARVALLIFLLTFGPITIIVGYITDNHVLANIVLPLSAYAIAILSVGIFEEVVNDGFKHLDKLFTKVVPGLLGWLLTKVLHPLVAYTILAIVLTMVLVTPRITPELHANACLQTPLRPLCGNGIGVTPISVDSNGQLSASGSLINIGIIDETVAPSDPTTSDPAPFDQYDTTNTQEKNVEDLIFQENRKADIAPHFTLAVAVPLSRTVTDNGFSAGVGLEDLKGAYLAQRDYNSRHDIKLRLIIANLGVKFAAQTIAPLVAARLVLYAKNGPADAHFIGVVGFPFSITAQQALPRLQQNDIQVISSSASSDLLSNEPDFYRIELTNKQQSQDMLNFIQNTLQPKSVVVMYDWPYNQSDMGDPYSWTLGDNIFNGLSNAGIVVSKQHLQVGHYDTLDQPLQNILSMPQKPDLLFFAGYSDDLNAFREKLNAQQQDQKRQGKSTYDLSTMRIIGGQSLYELGGYTGSNYSSIYFTTSEFPDAPNVVSFGKEYATALDPNKQHPGEYGYSRTGPDSALTYDAVNAYLQAVQQTSGNTGIPLPDKVKTALMNVSFTGLTGQTTFNGYSLATRSDPVNKLLYIACVNSKGQTNAIVEYGPGGSKPLQSPDVCA